MIKTIHNPIQKGILHLIMFAATFTLLIVGLFSATNFLAYRYITGPLPYLLRAGDLQVPILHLDEALTMSARLSVATGDPKWEARYRRLEPQLDQAFKEILNLNLEPAYIRAAMQSDAANKKLVVMENRAFELVRQGRQVQAQDLLSSEAYQAQKDVYAAGMAEVFRLIRQDVDSVRERRRVRLLWSLVLATILTPFLILGWWLVLRAVRRWQAAVVESNRQLNQKSVELTELNTQLDTKVSQRTKELNESALASMNMMEDAVKQRESAVQAYENLKREEAKLAANVLALARSNEELERFTYVSSHDLQEPLRSIASFTDLLIERHSGLGDKEDDQYAAFIKEGVQRMRDVLAGVRTYLGVSRDTPHPERVDLNLLLEKVLSDMSTLINEAGGTVTSDPLPTLMADERLFSQLLENLIDNAIRYHGSEPPRVHIQVQRQEAQWLFSVRDNGIGVDQKHAEGIFVMFQRLHTRDHYKGNGLGLAICKKVVERYGGRIWAEPGSPGLVVRFTVPDNAAGIPNPRQDKEKDLGPQRNAA